MPIAALPKGLPWLVTSPVIGSISPTYTALIAGSYVPILKGTINIQQQIGQRSQGSISVYTSLGTRWQYGTQCLLFDDLGNQVYGGYVARDKAYRAPGARQGDLGYLEHDLTLMDNCYRADKRVVFKRYDNTAAGSIVNDLLITYLADEGVITTSSSVASGATIVQAIWNGNKTVSEALTWLAERSGYWWNIDAFGVLWFQPYGGIAAPYALDGTTLDSVQSLSVESGNDLMVTRQYVKGSVAQTATLTETFKGDGTSRSFTLSYPLNTLTTVTLNALDITSLVLNKGDNGGFFYCLVGDPVVAQDPSRPVLTSSDTLVVTYIGQWPVLAAQTNAAAVAAQAARERTGTGIIEAVYSEEKVRSLPAAVQIAGTQLSHYGADLVVLTCSTRTTGFAPGQLLPVSLSDYALSNLPMLISGVSLSDSYDGINIWYALTAIGSDSSAQWAIEAAQYQTFFQRLMSQQSDPSDFTDANNTTLTPILISTAARTASASVSQNKHTCLICGNATLVGPAQLVC